MAEPEAEVITFRCRAFISYLISSVSVKTFQRQLKHQHNSDINIRFTGAPIRFNMGRVIL